MSSIIPPEIISDILVRLPVEPLLRFRAVSKPWCALIDSPDFIKRHLNRSITTKSNRSLYLGGTGTGTLFSLDYKALRTATPLEIPFEESDGVEIFGSCNGLLLLQGKDIALFNPATRKYRVLPGTPIEFPSCRVIKYFKKFGFGYDSVNDDYKVIRVVEFKDAGFRWFDSEAKIYSLKTNSWLKVEKFPFCLPYKRVWGVHLNGRLHTVVKIKTSIDPNPSDIIVAFDLLTENFHYIPLPDGLDKSYSDAVVEVVEGMLCVHATYIPNRTDIWLMRVCGVKESWFKLLSIGPPLVEPYAIISPLALSRNGGEVLLNDNDTRFIWYDLERKSVRRAPFRGLSDSFYVEICVDCLVPLDSTGESVSVKKVDKVNPNEVKDEKVKEVNEEKQKEVNVEKTKEIKKEKLKEKKIKERDGFLSVGFKLKL